MKMTPTPELVAQAKAFALAKWKERWEKEEKRYGDPEPINLSNACRFCALFARELFGGRIRANYYHCWVRLDDGTVLDLTDGVDAERFGVSPKRLVTASRDFMFDAPGIPNKEFWDNMRTCLPRVRQWSEEFRNRQTA